MAATTASSSADRIPTISPTESWTEIPLTTVFTPPTWCSSVPYTLASVLRGTSVFEKNIDNLGDSKISSCYPPNYALQFSAGVVAEYSPGVCPSGYVGLPLSQFNGISTSLCCPKGATATQYDFCSKTVTTSTTAVLSSDTIVVVDKPAIFLDRYMQIAYAASDFDKFTPASAPVLTSSSASASISTSLSSSVSPSISSPASTSSTASNAGLSGGAIAGIVVGTLGGLVLILAGIFFFLWRRKRAARLTASPPTAMDSTKYKPVTELDSHGLPSELAGGQHGEYYKPKEHNNDEKFSKGSDSRAELPSS